MIEAVQIFTTTDTEANAKEIADTLVAARLAACVQVVGPITSTYRWQGKIETAQEWLCIIKSTEALCDEVESAIRELHPYELPEIIAVAVTAGSQEYLEWLKGSVRE